MGGVAVPVAGVHVPAPGVGEEAVGPVLGEELEDGVLAAGFEFAGGRGEDLHAIAGVHVSRPAVVREWRAQLDAAAVVQQAFHGELEGARPDIGADFKGIRAADVFDADAIPAGGREVAEVHAQDVGPAVVAAGFEALLGIASDHSAIGLIGQESVATAATRGQIVDADYAKNTAALTRLEIQQKVSNAMLAQANVNPKFLLTLLGG